MDVVSQVGCGCATKLYLSLNPTKPPSSLSPPSASTAAQRSTIFTMEISKLPVELQRYIFLLAVQSEPGSMVNLSLVARRVKLW